MVSAVLNRLRAFCACALMLMPALPAQAELGDPHGPVLLRVLGNIAQANAGGEAHFDLDMLNALGSETIVTSTIWTEGEQTFQGVPLHAVLAALGVENGSLRATAVNDYSVEIPFSDAVPGGAMLAYARNGRMMTVRDKGPIWLIYPYDAQPEYQSETHYARSIWQLDRLEVGD